MGEVVAPAIRDKSQKFFLETNVTNICHETTYRQTVLRQCMPQFGIITSPMNDKIRIELPESFSIRHERLILKYLTSGRQSLTILEWRQLLEGFDLLHQARVQSKAGTQTFNQIFAAHVDQSFADIYINELLQLNDVSREHQALRARFARTIADRLRQAKLRQPSVKASNLLLAYCLYFWESFAKGYAFEVEIYRDLTNCGVDFKAHDIRNRAARFSAYDLQVLNLKGDIKTSLYFLSVARSRGLAHDFYITRLYEEITNGHWWFSYNHMPGIKSMVIQSDRHLKKHLNNFHRRSWCKSRIGLLSSWSIMFGKSGCYNGNPVNRK